MDEDIDLYWNALNYRTASIENAEEMWHELEKCVKKLIDIAVLNDRLSTISNARKIDINELNKT